MPLVSFFAVGGISKLTTRAMAPPPPPPCEFKTNTSEVFEFLLKNFRGTQSDTIEAACAEILEDRVTGCHGWTPHPNGAWQDETLPIPADAYSFILQSRSRKPAALLNEAFNCLSIMRRKKPAHFVQVNKLITFYSKLKFSLCSCEDVQHLLIHYQGKEIHSLDILFKQNGHVVLRKRED